MNAFSYYSQEKTCNGFWQILSHPCQHLKETNTAGKKIMKNFTHIVSHSDNKANTSMMEIISFLNRFVVYILLFGETKKAL